MFISKEKRIFGLMKRKIIWIVSVVLVVSLIVGVGFAVFHTNGQMTNTLRLKSPDPLPQTELSGGFADEKYIQVAENADRTLFLCMENGNFYIENKNDNHKWYANPENALEDPVATNICRMDLASSLFIQIYDLEKETTVKKNSETGCVRKGGLSLHGIKNGFLAEYCFSDYGITVPIEFTLEEEYFQVRVITDEIREESKDKFMLCGLSLLPNFGAADSTQSGYVLIPDGCGALMHFNNNRNQEYMQTLYSKDMALSVVNKPLNSEPTSLPLFGVQVEGSAFLSVITKGDAVATLHAYPNGFNSSYGCGYAEYSLRTQDTSVLDEKNIDALNVSLFQDKEMEATVCEQRYYFLHGEEADYNGMAKCYRNYLQNEQDVSTVKNDPESVFIDFYSCFRKKESVAGFPVERTAAVSTIKDISQQMEQLFNKIDGKASVRLMSWSKDGIRGKIDTKLKPDSAAGSLSQIKQLQAILDEHGGTLALSTDLIKYTKGGNGFSVFKNSIKTLSNSPAYQYEYLLSTRMKDPDSDRGYLLNPLYLKDAEVSLQKSKALKAVSALSPFNLTLSYGSYGKTLVTREDNKQAVIDLLAELSGYSKIYLNAPAAYAWGYTDVLVDVPLESGRYEVMDTEIPFYQLVASPFCSTVSTSLNLHSDPKALMLKSVVTGTTPHFSLVTGDVTLLHGSSFDTLYSSAMDTWIELILQADNYMQDILQITEGSAMTSYEILDEDIALISYENSAQLLVNFSQKDAVIQGQEISAMSYSERGSEK